MRSCWHTGIHPAFPNSTCDLRKTVVSFQSSEYLTPMLCRNLRLSDVSTVGLVLGKFADAEVKQSRQQSERGFTVQMLLRHRGHRQ